MLTMCAPRGSTNQLLSNKWMSSVYATLGPQFTSAPQYASGAGVQATWVTVPDMRVTAVHGLDDAEPAMAAALRHLAALTGDEETCSHQLRITKYFD